MKSKKRKDGKTMKKSSEDFVRDDIAIGPAEAEKKQKTKKEIKRSNPEGFHEYYY